jgi:hypothetical protein
MCVNLTHNNNIKTFDDVAHHVQLEEDQLHIEKLVNEAFVSETKMCGAYDSKYRKGKGKGKGPTYSKRRIEANSNRYKRKRGKSGGKKDKNMNYFNCGKPDHFTRDCTEPKTQEQPIT